VSYSPLGNPAGMGWAGAAPACTVKICMSPGGEGACPSSTLDKSVYIGLKGASSWQHYKEAYVRYVLHVILDDTNGSGGRGADDWAYDKFEDPDGLVRNSPELKALKAAAIRYWQVFPPARWKKHKGAKSRTCGENTRNYSTWSTGAHVDAGTAAQKASIWALPLGNDAANYAFPRPEVIVDWGLVPRLTASSPGAKPKITGLSLNPWLKSFVKAFAPPVSGMKFVAASPGPRYVAAKPPAQTYPTTQKSTPEPSQGRTTATTVALVALGAVALGGTALWWVKRGGS